MNIILVLIDRIRTESPKFFVILRWITGVLAVIGWAATWLISNGIWSPDYSDAIQNLASALGAAATGMWATSLFPKKDQVVGGRPDDRNNPTP